MTVAMSFLWAVHACFQAHTQRRCVWLDVA
jgi:hypothetical protein